MSGLFGTEDVHTLSNAKIRKACVAVIKMVSFKLRDINRVNRVTTSNNTGDD